jgi:hypothetical protein
MGKTGTIERFIWKKFDNGLFIYRPRGIGGMNLDLFYTVIFLEEMQKINSRICSSNVRHMNI